MIVSTCCKAEVTPTKEYDKEGGIHWMTICPECKQYCNYEEVLK